MRPEQILSDDAVRDKPRARFGGTLFSKYNRGVRGQFFLAIRETGCETDRTVHNQLWRLHALRGGWFSVKQ